MKHFKHVNIKINIRLNVIEEIQNGVSECDKSDRILNIVSVWAIWLLPTNSPDQYFDIPWTS
jgi:hypothetical protein